MKQAEIRQEEEENELEQSKLKDLSEWKTSIADQYKLKAKNQTRVISAGFTSINSINKGTPIVGRRTFEEDKPKKEQKEEGNADNANKLDEIWKQDKEDRDKKSQRPEVGHKRARDVSPKKTFKKRRSEN